MRAYYEITTDLEATRILLIILSEYYQMISVKTIYVLV